jgi:hypothetical protein
MTPDEFRSLALSLPEAVEGAHHGHADFRVRGKVFASLGYPDAARAMVALTPAQQADAVADDPASFRPVAGGWGERGATHVFLAAATEQPVRRALVRAWRNKAPKRLLPSVPEE